METSSPTSFRDLMPVCQQWTYLDHAAVAPLPKPAMEAIGQWMEEAGRQGDAVWPQWNRRVEDTRSRAARLLHAEIEEIALVPSTTAGITLVAEGFPWRAGDNVVTLENEFPSNLFPWLNLATREVETRRVPVERGRVDLNRILETCDERTRLVSISWIGYASGWRIELDSVVDALHARGILVMLDAIQGLGVFPLDVQQTPVDFLASDGHKWMLGPEGAGIFYLRKEHLDRLRPFGVGWHSVQDWTRFDHRTLQLRHDAARYEGGTQNMAGFIGFGASLELLLREGVSAQTSPVAERVVRLADEALERLQAIGAYALFDRPAEHRSGILTFALPGQEPQRLRRKCLAAKIALSCRGGGLRISPHGYNNVDDLQHLVEVLHEACRSNDS